MNISYAIKHIAVALLCCVFIFWAGFFTGVKRTQRINAIENAEYINNLRQQENQIRSDYDEIIQNLTEKQNTISFQSNSLRSSYERLRDSTNKMQTNIITECPNYSKTIFGELFIRCAKEYSTVAEYAERHATDAEQAVKAWKKVKSNFDNINTQNE